MGLQYSGAGKLLLNKQMVNIPQRSYNNKDLISVLTRRYKDE